MGLFALTSNVSGELEVLAPQKSRPDCLIGTLQGYGSNNPEAEQLAKAVMMIDRFVGDKDFLSLEQVMERISVKNLAPAVMIALLRTTSAVRSEIFVWKSFRDKVKAEFLQRGKPIDRALRGLL